MNAKYFVLRLLVLTSFLLALVAPASNGALAASNLVLVYDGNGALDEGYTLFGNATGKQVETLFTLPDDLSQYDCVILPINSVPFDDTQKQILSNYISAGGRVLALAEWSSFPGAIGTMNDLASSLGSGLSVISNEIDLGFHTTTNIDATDLTAGVSTIEYAATSAIEVEVSGTAQSLVRSIDGVTFVGADQLGQGFFVLSGDSNVFSDFTVNGYAIYDNGVLATNLCNASLRSFVLTAPFTISNVTAWTDPPERTVTLAALKGLSTVLESQQDLDSGTLGYQIFAWGGLKGSFNAFVSPEKNEPSEQAYIQSLMGTEFTAPSAGNYVIRAEIEMHGNGKAVAGDGALDFALEFIPGGLGKITGLVNPAKLLPKATKATDVVVLKINSMETRNTTDFHNLAADTVLLSEFETTFDGIVIAESTVQLNAGETIIITAGLETAIDAWGNAGAVVNTLDSKLVKIVIEKQ